MKIIRYHLSYHSHQHQHQHGDTETVMHSMDDQISFKSILFDLFSPKIMLIGGHQNARRCAYFYSEFNQDKPCFSSNRCGLLTLKRSQVIVILLLYKS